MQAILSAGHIPAGMELFTAGDQSQWEVIKHWIDQSDVFLLILGGRYGSIETETGKSYIHLEYEYALEKEIPVFSCVLRDPDTRAMDKGNINQYLERNKSDQYKKFKDLVTSKIVKFWDNSEQIKTSIILTLKKFEKRDELIGWMRRDQQENEINLQKKQIEGKFKKELEDREKSYQTEQQQLEEFFQCQINQLKQELEQMRSQTLQQPSEPLFIENNKLENPLESIIELVDISGNPLIGAQIVAVADNNTTKQPFYNSNGMSKLSFKTKRNYDLLIAHKNFKATVIKNQSPGENSKITLDAFEHTSSLIFPHRTGYIEGLQGRLNPILDTQYRTYLYATNIAINGGKQHPVNFKLNESMILEDCDGVIMQVTFKYIKGNTSLLEYKKI